MDILFESIKRYIRLSPALREALTQRVVRREFCKGESVLESGTVCRESYFIERGILRLYYLQEGREVSEFFCSEREWINSPRSFIQQQTDIYSIDAIEDSVAWGLSVQDLVALFDQYPEMERYARMDMGSTFGYVMARLTSLKFTSARDRYRDFLETYQGIHHRIPLGMAASYMGITQETLSRLRKK